MGLIKTLKNSLNWPLAPINAWPLVPIIYLAISFVSGEYNPLKWSESYRQEQEFGPLVNKIGPCVDRDGVSGFSVKEINELYQRAGINFKVRPRLDSDLNFNTNYWTGDFWTGSYYEREEVIRAPPLAHNDLKRIAASCK